MVLPLQRVDVDHVAVGLAGQRLEHVPGGAGRVALVGASEADAADRAVAHAEVHEAGVAAAVELPPRPAPGDRGAKAELYAQRAGPGPRPLDFQVAGVGRVRVAAAEPL